MTYYILYQTDRWQSKQSRVFFGLFATQELANLQAIHLSFDDCQPVIQPVLLNAFGEH